MSISFPFHSINHWNQMNIFRIVFKFDVLNEISSIFIFSWMYVFNATLSKRNIWMGLDQSLFCAKHMFSFKLSMHWPRLIMSCMFHSLSMGCNWNRYFTTDATNYGNERSSISSIRLSMQNNANIDLYKRDMPASIHTLNINTF